MRAIYYQRSINVHLFFITCLLAISQIFIIQRASAQEETTPAEASAGRLLMKSDAGNFHSAVSLESQADFQISGMIAQVNVTQSFHNDSTEWREAVYVFPLPENAAVGSLLIRIGERVIEGKIHEREEAKAIYQAARTAGKKAGLVEQERPNLFTTSVANIGPDETVVVELSYVQTVSYEAGEFSLRFPMTITPRYIPGDPLSDDNREAEYSITGDGWAYPTQQVADAPRVTPYQHPQPASAQRIINPISISADIHAGMPLANVQSPWHDIRVTRNSEQYHLELADGPVSMSRDFELRWRPESGREPQAALFTETIDGDHFALLMLVPPTQTSTADILPREMIFVIDTSGSMGGVSIEQARQGLLMALDRLRPTDRFNIIEFNSNVQALFPTSQPLSTPTLQQARQFVSGLRAQGGTEMHPALSLALDDEAESGLLRQVIFMTDGAVANETALFQLIRERLGNSRLFTVGIGSAPNSYFMRKAASFGRGTFSYIGSTSELRERMQALFTQLDSPLASDFQLQWPAAISGEVYPERVPDLYQGEPLILAARVSDFNDSVAITGQTANREWRRELTLSNDRQSPGIASVWARARISDLLDQKTAGRAEEEVRDAVLEVALAHQLVSPYTSFVAVENTPTRPSNEALEKAVVANARPEGQADQTYAWPATATASRWHLLLGALMVLLAVLLHIARRSPLTEEVRS